MKHVFIINSHTTFLTVCGTINYEELNQNDIVLLSIRGYKAPLIDNFRIIDLTDFSISFKEGINNSSAERRKLIRELDCIIEEKINDKYIFYAPHFASFLFQAIYTNKNCLRGAYVQEGALPQPNAFLTKLSIKQILQHIYYDIICWRTTRVWRTWYWYIKGSLYKQKSIESYSINNIFFKYLPSNNHIVVWPELKISESIRKGSVFFIFDGFVGNGIIESDYYLNVCTAVIKENGCKDNYIKFHPGQVTSEREAILNVFKDNHLNFKVLGDQTPVEIIISSFKDLVFVGFSSSLLYFAYIYGHRVISRDFLLFNSDLYNIYKKTYGVKSYEENIKELL